MWSIQASHTCPKSASRNYSSIHIQNCKENGCEWYFNPLQTRAISWCVEGIARWGIYQGLSKWHHHKMLWRQVLASLSPHLHIFSGLPWEVGVSHSTCEIILTHWVVAGCSWPQFEIRAIFHVRGVLFRRKTFTSLGSWPIFHRGCPGHGHIFTIRSLLHALPSTTLARQSKVHYLKDTSKIRPWCLHL